MYLSRLDIHGFKSFATKTGLDFQRGITAIVGPNGSGKSNVADAIRWVLGEQSLKLLRGKRSDDVIFAGSDKKARLGVAEVSLYLNNEDRRAPIDYSELVITRRVFRDGEGEYLINRQPARLQDIQLLLAQANFGQRTYSVIGQGMIDNFLMSGPQERKHLFDEAAGVRQYQLKKDQALQKLTHAKENLTQGEALMTEIEPRLRSLTRQVRRLERREEVERNLRQKQTQYYALRWHNEQAELRRVRGEFDAADRRRQDIATEVAAIQAELEKIEHERTGSEVFIGLQRTYNDILDTKNAAVQELAVAKGRLELQAQEAPAAQAVFIDKQVTELKRRLSRFEDEHHLETQALERKKRRLDEVTVRWTAAEKDFGALEQELRRVEARWKQSYTWPQAQAELRSYFTKYDAFVNELSRTEINPEHIHRTANTLRQELKVLIDRIGAAGQVADPHDLIGLQQRTVAMSADRQRLSQELAERRGEVRLAEDHVSRIADEVNMVKQELSKFEQEASLEHLAMTDPAAAKSAYAEQTRGLERKIEELDHKLTAARNEINAFNNLETEKKERLFALQKSFRDSQQQLNRATHDANERQVQMARLEQRQDDLNREIEQAMPVGSFDAVTAAAEQNPSGDQNLLAEEISQLSHQLQLIGGIDEQVTGEYKETSERWEFLRGQADDLRSAIASLEQAIAELDVTIKKRFDAAFRKINDEFHQYFRTLFRGGKAELVLIEEVFAPEQPPEDSEDRDGEEDNDTATSATPVKGEKVVTGIDIKATPPGKKLQSVTMLSGGERALTSIALLCAIISNNPSPFVVLDEVDAALDEANSQRFAHILDHLAHNTQFITITHNRATMEKATILYGVTMGDDGVSQLLSVKMDEAEEIIRKHGNR